MTAIEFENVGKQYRLGLVSTKTLSHDINRWWQTSVLHREDPYLKIGETNDRATKGNSEYVWALKDINFKVEQGDVVGIIGKNGAGKSTLLKLLSKVTGPTTGVIRARGRIGSLLEVGTGFHSEMTGRENIYLNGAILGMTRGEISRKLDEIIDFSGCERYIDTPVKRYSSGMMVRLGFAVAAHLDPEILVVDEVLAVGDAEFQKKAIGKMQDVSRGEGRTVLFVSHNMGSIRQLCRIGMVLDKGSIVYIGSALDAVGQYMGASNGVQGRIIDSMSIRDNDVKIESITVNGSENNVVKVSPDKIKLEFDICGELNRDKKMSVEVRVKDAGGATLLLYSPFHFCSPIIKKGRFHLNGSFDLPEGLCHGLFFLNIILAESGVDIIVNFGNAVRVESVGSPTDTGIILNYPDNSLIYLK